MMRFGISLIFLIFTSIESLNNNEYHNEYQLVLRAVKKCDVSKVESLLNEFESRNIKESIVNHRYHGDILLHTAVKYCRDIRGIFHDFRSNYDFRTETNLEEKLFKFFGFNRQKQGVQIVKLLVNSENLKIKNINGMTAINLASYYNQLEILDSLITATNFSNLSHILEIADKNSYTPLVWAVKLGYFDIVEYLINLEADISVLNSETTKNSLLRIALQFREMKIAQLLVNKAIEESKELYVQNGFDWVSLSNHADLVFKMSLQLEISPPSESSKKVSLKYWKFTASDKNYSLWRVPCKRIPDSMIAAIKQFEFNPFYHTGFPLGYLKSGTVQSSELCFSVRTRKFKMFTSEVRYFDTKDVDPVIHSIDVEQKLTNFVDSVGCNILMVALMSKNRKLANWAIHNKLEIHHRDNDGRSALFYAVRFSDVTFVDLLVSKGYPVNSFDKNGNSLLHVAAASGSLPMFKSIYEKLQSLLDSMNNQNLLDSKNKQGLTPLHIAIESGERSDDISGYIIIDLKKILDKNDCSKILESERLLKKFDAIRYCITQCDIRDKSLPSNSNPQDPEKKNKADANPRHPENIADANPQAQEKKRKFNSLRSRLKRPFKKIEEFLIK